MPTSKLPTVDIWNLYNRIIYVFGFIMMNMKCDFDCDKCLSCEYCELKEVQCKSSIAPPSGKSVTRLNLKAGFCLI